MNIFISRLILTFFLTNSFNAFSASADTTSSFYSWLAQSQVMSFESLKLDVDYVPSGLASVERIANSTPMLKFYADELSRQGVPMDFVILPLIESGNNPQARSPANALGLWQFMPLTGREWGLKNDQLLDERTDVQKSTIAAASYLKSLHNQFHDWNLVLASYNWGPASVEKALKRGLRSPNGKINLSLLPLETRNYLISFHAFNRLIRDNYKNIQLAKYPNKPYLIKIDSNSLDAHIKSTPGLSSIDESVLRHMNGFSLNLRQKSPGSILVPTQTFAHFFMPNKISFKLTSSPGRSMMSSCNPGHSEYKVRYGETLQSISNRFKMSVDRLIDLNPSVRFARPGVNLILC